MDLDMTQLPPAQPSPNAEAAYNEHLKLLAIFHYVLAGLAALGSLIPIIYVIIGLVMLVGGLAASGDEGAPPAITGLFFACGGFFCGMLPGMLFALALANAGRKLQARQSHTYCVVVAAICCILFPIGTVLGILTLVVLTKPEVKAMFERNNQPPIEVV